MTFSIPETYAERETMECVSQFFAGAKNSDLLVLYYAGHAIQNPFTLVRYICPIIHDVERDRTNLPPPPSTTQKNIQIPWEPIHTLLLLDCCHAMASVHAYSRTKVVSPSFLFFNLSLINIGPDCRKSCRRICCPTRKIFFHDGYSGIPHPVDQIFLGVSLSYATSRRCREQDDE